jgi:GT2 family glycosyltransferase
LAEVQPELSVVIPTHERPEKLRRALDHLEAQRNPPPHEVIVVANAGDDMTEVADAVGRRAVQPRLLVAGAPGASAARNRGWREARAPLVLFVGDDILAGPTLLTEHVSWHTSNPEEVVGVLGHVRWARELTVTPFMRWLDRGMQFDYGAIEGTEADAGHLYTANVSLKRALIERSGGFDEGLPYLFEDIDLGRRLSELGLRLLYNRRAEAEHLHEATLDSWKARMRVAAPAELRFVRTHPGAQARLYEQMSRAAAAPAARGRAGRIVRFVPRWIPVLGPIVWGSAEQRWLQELAPEFLAAWAEAERAPSAGERTAR